LKVEARSSLSLRTGCARGHVKSFAGSASLVWGCVCPRS